EGRTQFKAKAHNLRLAHSDKRRDDLNSSFLRAGAYHLVESVVVGWAAIRIPRAILLDRSNVNLGRTQHFCPANRHREKMRVAEWDVGHRNIMTDCCRFRHGNAGIRQCRTSDGAQSLVANDKPITDT